MLGKAETLHLVIVAAFVAGTLGGCQQSGKKMESIMVGYAEREAVRMEHRDAIHFRSGMHVYVTSLHMITEALGRNDRPGIAKGAGASGMFAVNDISIAMVSMLPPQFILLATDTHQRFDAMATAAKAGSTRSELLTKLSDILANCIACHEAYRLEEH